MQKTLLFNRIEKLQDTALNLGDLKTAIKLNWLKYSMDSMEIDDIIYKLQLITLCGKYKD